MTREEKIAFLANQLEVIVRAMPHMCCMGRAVDDDGREQKFVVGFDGYINFRVLAEWVYARMG